MGPGGAPAPPSTDRTAAASSPRVLPWGIFACDYVVANVPVQPDALRPYLPEGFEPEEAQGPLALAQGGAYLGVEMMRCESGAGLDGNVTDLHYGSFFTTVVPPANASDPDAGLQMVKWDALVPDAPRRDVLAAAGLPARDGSVTLSREAAPARVAATLTLDGLGAYAIEGTAPRPGNPFGGTFVEFMPSQHGGLARWRADYESEAFHSGWGTLTLEPGTWPAEVAGGTHVTASFFTGRWTFPRGNITLPS